MSSLEASLLRQETGVVAAVFLAPFMFVLFLRNGLVAGVDQAIPGMATLFAFFMVGFTCYTFFREHGLNTWARLQASPLSTWEVVIGKAIPYAALGTTQLVALFALGALTGMRLQGSILVLGVACLMVPVCSVSLSVLVFSLTKSLQEATTLANFLSLLLAGICGAFAPISSMPGWVQTVAHLFPQYWTMTIFNTVVDGSSTASAVGGLLIIGLFTVGFAAIAVTRFDRNAVKRFRDA